MDTNEPLVRGELVTLRQYPTPDQPLGRVVSVAADGTWAEVAWTRYAGHEHEVTSEPAQMLRRVHESEMDPAE